MKSLLHHARIAWLMAGIGLLLWAGAGWGSEQSPGVHADVSILAAGFGFQAGGESIIVIKIYNARTGEVLSEESFDLAVIEDGAPTSSQTTGRIFAGGVGDGDHTGRDGLSRFFLRVYDAQTGNFLWEGQLNLPTGGEGETARPVAQVVRPAVTLRPTAQESGPTVQPYYLVRALDPNTKTMVWQDQFALDGNGHGTSRATGYRPLRPVSFRDLGHEFEMMVSAYDRISGSLLWVDTFDSLEHEAASEEEARARVLPSWPVRQRNAAVSFVVWKDADSTSCRFSALR